MITELNERSRDVFCKIVDNYVATGEPIGSRTLAKRLAINLSPASIRNVMADHYSNAPRVVLPSERFG